MFGLVAGENLQAKSSSNPPGIGDPAPRNKKLHREGVSPVIWGLARTPAGAKPSTTSCERAHNSGKGIAAHVWTGSGGEPAGKVLLKSPWNRGSSPAQQKTSQGVSPVIKTLKVKTYTASRDTASHSPEVTWKGHRVSLPPSGTPPPYISDSTIAAIHRTNKNNQPREKPTLKTKAAHQRNFPRGTIPREALR